MNHFQTSFKTHLNFIKISLHRNVYDAEVIFGLVLKNIFTIYIIHGHIFPHHLIKIIQLSNKKDQVHQLMHQ